jgi:hypothetical protein
VATNIVPESTGNNSNYKDFIRKQLEKAVLDASDQETHKMNQLLAEERQKAVAELVEENQHVIKGIVEDGKKLVWSKAQLSVTIDALKTEFRDDLVRKIYFRDAKN